MEHWGMAKRVVEKPADVFKNNTVEMAYLNKRIHSEMVKMGFKTQEIWDLIFNMSDVKQARWIKKILEVSNV